MVMNEVYTENPEYNSKAPSAFGIKLPIITDFFRYVEGEILDIGCGQGDNMRELIDSGRNVFGIDFSEVCCEKYLSDLPHECTDVISYCSDNNKYEAALCSGVLEQIKKSELDRNLSAINNVAGKFLLGVANHSDVQFGHQLHVIQEGVEWWVKRLSKHFSRVRLVDLWPNGRFFFIKCDRELKKK